MIPNASITAWRKTAPWGEDWQVEQDLILSRALVDLFGRPAITEQAAFRGGTALHKLFFEPPGRYSEDIDLVQRDAGPIGPLIDEIRDALDLWLGEPKWKAGKGRFSLRYHFETTHDARATGNEAASPLPAQEGAPPLRPRPIAGPRRVRRRPAARGLRGVHGFGGTPVTRAQFEANMAAKIADAPFLNDVPPLLRTGVEYDPTEAWSRVHSALVRRLPGDPWKGEGDAE